LACAQAWRASYASAHQFRVLAFHGGGSNAAVFQYQCKQIQLAFSESLCWDFVQGTHKCSEIVDPLADAIEPDTEKFSWYDVRYDNADGARNATEQPDSALRVAYHGVDAALMRLVSTLESRPRYDAFFAFSQGAVIATLLLQRLPSTLVPTLVVLASPIAPRDQVYIRDLFPNAPKLQVPCVLTYGDSVHDFAHRYAESVSQHFLSSTTQLHDEGHNVPQKAGNADSLARLMQTLLNIQR